MTQNMALLIVAAIVVGLIPIVPKMVGLRIKVLRWLRLNRLADWHERNIKTLTPIVRGIMGAIALVLIGIVVL